MQEAASREEIFDLKISVRQVQGISDRVLNKVSSLQSTPVMRSTSDGNWEPAPSSPPLQPSAGSAAAQRQTTGLSASAKPVGFENAPRQASDLSVPVASSLEASAHNHEATELEPSLASQGVKASHPAGEKKVSTMTANVDGTSYAAIAGSVPSSDEF